MLSPLVLTIHQFAAMLHLGLDEAFSLAQVSVVSYSEVGAQGRFGHLEIEGWTDELKRLGLKGGGL